MTFISSRSHRVPEAFHGRHAALRPARSYGLIAARLALFAAVASIAAEEWEMIICLDSSLSYVACRSVDLPYCHQA